MLVELCLSKLANLVQGQLVGTDAKVTSLTQDARHIQAGGLYVALVGERFDGHEFLAQAQAGNACGALVKRLNSTLPDLPQIVVAEPLVALQTLANWHRQQFKRPVVAITGSAGKTSCKEMLAAVLRQQGACCATQGNLNNHIGVPLTLMRLGSEHHSAVLELGANHAGEIAATAKLVRPDVGLISNASDAHLQGFKNLETVVQTKGELLDFIQPNGTAILNKDDVHYAIWQKRAKVKSLSFGLKNPADVSAKNIIQTETGSQFTLCYLHQTQSVTLPLLGEHNLLNALGVSAAAISLGVSLADIAQGLAQVATVQGRLSWHKGIRQSRLLDDSYNASPASVYAAIDVLSGFSNNLLVLGELAELGAQAQQIHQQIGAYAKAQGIERVYACGAQTEATVSAFGAGAKYFACQQQLIEHLQQHLQAHSVVLVKGARSSAMEKVVQALTYKEENSCCYG